jgi:tripartite-type tricarboxylate transporter receptor subunit TctC
MAPPGIPKDRVQFLEDALTKTVNDAEFLAWAKGAGVDLGPLSGEETRKMVFKLFDLFEQYKGNIEKYLKQ